MATVKKVKKYQKSGPPIKATSDSTGYYRNKVKDVSGRILKEIPNLPLGKSSDPKEGQKMRDLVSEKKKLISNQLRQSKKGKPGYDANGFPIKKNKTGGKVTTAKNGKQMLKRADGSVSQRGLWDNIRANKGSGKKPTAQMLKQEKKIKAKSKK